MGEGLRVKVDFYQKAKEAEEEIKRYYTHLHKHPELSGQEYQTQEWILSQLKQWGVECRTCADTGVYAIIRSGKPGYTIAFRADMDALPIQEQTGLSWSSEENGVMHACGHDAHMTVLLGCIRILHENREQLYGNIVFLFQPSEEHQGGAARMIVDGAMKTPKPDLIVAFHVWPQRAGTITCMSGPVMAQPDAFSIELIGKGGHGATPHICRNPIPAMAALINAIGNITANDISAQETAVVNICRIRCGEKYNIIAEKGYLEGTIRTYDTKVREEIIRRLKKLTTSIADAWEIEGSYYMDSGYPATINNKTAACWAAEILKKEIPEVEILTEGEPSMLGEDFSCYGTVCPSLFLKLGCWKEDEKRHFPLHSSCFEIEESILLDGIAAFCILASAFSEKGFERINEKY